MTTDGRNLLTHSRMTCAKTCLRKHWYAYEFGIRKERDSQPLRMGAAFHHGIEEIGVGVDIDFAVNAACADYQHFPAWCITPEDQLDWEIEGVIVECLIRGYVERWGQSPQQTVAVETQFDLPLVNPETGASTPLWRIAGKIDKIVSLDGRLLISELKTAGEEIDAEADYWKRLRIDQQISLYMIAARQLGHDVQGIIYDVTRKPLIRPRKLTKAENCDIAATGNYCGSPGVTGERETPQMYGARLLVDMRERPDWYFARREVARLEADLSDFAYELWQYQGILRDCQRTGRWPRNTSACLHPYKCEYWELCTGGYDTASGTTPDGFKRLDFVHPELQPETAVGA